MSQPDYHADIFRKPPKELDVHEVDRTFIGFGGKPSKVTNWQAIALTAITLAYDHFKRPTIWTPDAQRPSERTAGQRRP